MKKLLSLILLSVTISAFAENPVRMWEGTISIPTYRVNPPEKAPIFAQDFAYQRAKRWVYPYAMNDNPTNEKVDSIHRALFLENDYLVLCVLPDIGGRLFYATDKTDGYEIFYRQHVIKPQNVGMLGAWISGGVEWNAFHHHRATSQYPIDYKLVDNGDGSKTIWVGEVEHRHGMSWAIGLTLFPDRSYIKVTGRFINGSPDRNSMLHWNNVATHANDSYQILFPESATVGMFHHKLSHIHWPIANEPYKGNEDFVGVDVSFWKNLPSLKGDSVFIYDLQDDWLGGYDYSVDAGTILVGDHNINKGGKFWTWGNKAYGHAWDCVTLTDEDGPYVELMTSAYSDNQPDYCWINPGETKEFTAYWYGVHDMKGKQLEDVQTSERVCLRGNQEATVNLEISGNGEIHLAAITTRRYPDAILKLTAEGREIYSKVVSISPDKPFSDWIQVDSSLVSDPTRLTVGLYSSSNELLIEHHQIIHDINTPLPADLKPVNPDPRSIPNSEECYYIGMRNLQFHQAHVNPNDYFEEVLRRDPLDVRSNTQMGIYYRKAGDFEKAKKYLRTAISRQTANYTRPSDGEAMYNLGLVLKSEGLWKAAIDTLYRAVWDYEYASAGYYQLAQISSITDNPSKSLDEAKMAVDYNGKNISAKNLCVTLLRKSGAKGEAIRVANEVLAEHPLDYYSMRELMKMGVVSLQEFKGLLRGESESYLDLAVGYLDNGFVEDCREILEESEQEEPSPIVEYYLGYLLDMEGDEEAARSMFKMASASGIDYVFPFRLETVKPLTKALEYFPEDPVTEYYLGNLWYQRRPELAREAWEKAVGSNPHFSMVLRNLGWYWRYKDENRSYKDDSDYKKAIDYYSKAIAEDPSEAIFLTECDEIMELTNSPLADRYKLFMGKDSIWETRYDSEIRAVKQQILHGDYDEAFARLTSRFYSRREHIDDLHDIYVDLCQLIAFQAWKEGDDAKALEYQLFSSEYPANQGYAHLEYYGRDVQVCYYIGLAYEKVGEADKAMEWYGRAASLEVRDPDALYLFEKGKSLEKLGKRNEARQLYKHALHCGRNQVTEGYNTFFESFGRGPYDQEINTVAYLTQAMALKGLGRNSASRRLFKKSLAERSDNVWANYYLGNLDKE